MTHHRFVVSDALWQRCSTAAEYRVRPRIRALQHGTTVCFSKPSSRGCAPVAPWRDTYPWLRHVEQPVPPLPTVGHTSGVFERLFHNMPFGVLLVGKAFDNDWLLTALDVRGAIAGHPPKGQPQTSCILSQGSLPVALPDGEFLCQDQGVPGSATRDDKNDSSDTANWNLVAALLASRQILLSTGPRVRTHHMRNDPLSREGPPRERQEEMGGWPSCLASAESRLITSAGTGREASG